MFATREAKVRPNSRALDADTGGWSLNAAGGDEEQAGEQDRGVAARMSERLHQEP